jgi:hypothetical protein
MVDRNRYVGYFLRTVSGRRIENLQDAGKVS